MPFTVHGLGTDFYGESDWRPDGSFRTTKWFVVFWFPLIPLKSLRVMRDPGKDVQAVVLHSFGYRVLEVVPMSAGQVARTYGFALLALAWIALVGWRLIVALGANDRSVAGGVALFFLGVIAACLPFVVLARLRHLARARARS